MHRKTKRTLDELGHVHELTFSCYNRMNLLKCDETKAAFLDRLDKARRRHGFLVIAYVVMDNHVHLLVWPGSNPVLPVATILRTIKQPFASDMAHAGRAVRVGSESRFWLPGGGYDRNITSRKALQASVDYIHMNPVRKGLCETTVSYPWSSGAAYAGLIGSYLEPDLSFWSL